MSARDWKLSTEKTNYKLKPFYTVVMVRYESHNGGYYASKLHR